jgi:hypothetical protein
MKLNIVPAILFAVIGCAVLPRYFQQTPKYLTPEQVEQNEQKIREQKAREYAKETGTTVVIRSKEAEAAYQQNDEPSFVEKMDRYYAAMRSARTSLTETEILESYQTAEDYCTGLQLGKSRGEMVVEAIMLANRAGLPDSEKPKYGKMMAAIMDSADQHVCN